jgi:hypothetical protein
VRLAADGDHALQRPRTDLGGPRGDGAIAGRPLQRLDRARRVRLGGGRLAARERFWLALVGVSCSDLHHASLNDEAIRLGATFPRRGAPGASPVRSSPAD